MTKGRPRKIRESLQISLRVTTDWVARADAAVDLLDDNGTVRRRADVLREALLIGLATIEKRRKT